MRSTLFLAALLLPVSAFAAEYAIDPAHSSAQFSVRHMMVSNVKGAFSKVTGTVHYDPATPAATRIDATIDAASIDTRNEKRDTHLKSPDFFDAVRFPTLTFKSKQTSKLPNGRLQVKGDLAMHGVTREVTLDVEAPTTEVSDPNGMQRLGATATTKLNRKDYGLTWSKLMDNGGAVVGDEIEVTLDLEVTRKPAGVANSSSLR